MNVCSRCGAHIKYTFKVGDFVFGSECIFKVDEGLMRKLYGERLDLGAALMRWANRQLRSKAKGALKDVSIDPDSIPTVGAQYKDGSSLVKTVEGYTEYGLRVSSNWKGRKLFNVVPFDQVSGRVVELVSTPTL
jgi:hypothetical protein